MAPPGTSYQNSTNGNAPIRVDQIGISPEDYIQNRRNRRLLFTGMILILLLLVGILAAVVIDDTKPPPAPVSSSSDMSQGGVQPNWKTPSFWSSNSSPKLDSLNELTKVNAGHIKSGCESTLVIIRHCEKEGPAVEDLKGDQHCAYIGHERAHFLPTLFGPNKWPVPTILYALSSGRSKWTNYREIETLTPLATKYNLPIHGEFGTNEEIVEDYFAHLSTGELCGKVALVSWKHSMIGGLAELLGCPDCPAKFPEASHDEVWQIKFVYNVIETAIFKEKLKQDNDIQDTKANGMTDKEHNGNLTIFTSSTATEEEDEATTEAAAAEGEEDGDDAVEQEEAGGGADDGSRRNLRQVRQLKKKKKKHHKKKFDDDSVRRLWSVFSTRTEEGFDPLKFSNMVGDYNGSPAGGKWMLPPPNDTETGTMTDEDDQDAIITTTTTEEEEDVNEEM